MTIHGTAMSTSEAQPRKPKRRTIHWIVAGLVVCATSALYPAIHRNIKEFRAGFSFHLPVVGNLTDSEEATLGRFLRFDALDQINRADFYGCPESLFSSYAARIETNKQGVDELLRSGWQYGPPPADHQEDLSQVQTSLHGLSVWDFEPQSPADQAIVCDVKLKAYERMLGVIRKVGGRYIIYIYRDVVPADVPAPVDAIMSQGWCHQEFPGQGGSQVRKWLRSTSPGTQLDPSEPATRDSDR
jgi:hypothetical protein